MDLETLKGFATAKDVLDQSIADYKPGETGFENLSPKERFNNLWDGFMQLGEVDTEQASGCVINTAGQTETGVPIHISVVLGERRAPHGSLQSNVRKVEASPSSGNPTEPLGDEPESIDSLMISGSPSDDPHVLETLAKLEGSLKAVRKLKEAGGLFRVNPLGGETRTLSPSLRPVADAALGPLLAGRASQDSTS